MVGLEKTPPGHHPPLPLQITQLRTRTAAGVLDRVYVVRDESLVAAKGGGESETMSFANGPRHPAEYLHGTRG
jgi:hypothetical protein